MSLKRFALVAALVLSGCDVATSIPQSPPKADEKVTSATSPATTPVAASAALPRDARAMARAFVRVVEQVEPVAESECRRRSPSLNCDFLIALDDRPGQPPNAFQTVDENGRPIIAFTVSLIATVQNADELAFVMAHEAAHHIEGHIARQQDNAMVGAIVFGQMMGVMGGDAEAIRSAQEVGAAVGARSYSKDFELEADRLGAVIAYRAGYDPLRGAEFFFRVPDPGDRFLGTHPANADRYAAVQQVATRL